VYPSHGAQSQRFVVSNAVCLSSGFISNATTFFFTWSKLSFIVCTAGLLVQFGILIGLLVAIHFLASFDKVPGDSHFTQAYYYAIISAALSATTLFYVTSYGAVLIKVYHSRPLTVGSTASNLYRQSIALIAYLLLGAAIFAHIENWSFLDAVFWADFTLLTIGLGGELTPKTSLGRALLLPYAIGGIVLIALLVVSVPKLLRDARSRQTDHLIDISRKRLEKQLMITNGTSASLGDENVFNLVRRIPRNVQRRYSLKTCAFSVIATIILLLGGASVFHVAETDQTWTYPVSAYFAYGSLLTIGYGDFIPNSDASKSFFVVWSLLSVPILTIFIHDSIDAVYGSARGLSQFFVQLMQHCRCYWMRIPQSHQPAQASQSSHSRHHEVIVSYGVNVELHFRRADDFLNSMIPEHDGGFRSQENTTVGISEVDLRTHCCLLARELGVITKDLFVEPGKKYSYQEWAYYINLMRRTTSHQRLNEETEQNEGPGCAHNDRAGQSSRLRPIHSIQWASRGTPILLSNEAEWLLLWLSSELKKSLHALLPHENEHLSLDPRFIQP
jgi:potassium channel subfamily K